MRVSSSFAVLVVVLVVGGCACVDASRTTPEQAWTRAEAAWQRRDLAAYEAWLAIDADSPEGRRARARLDRADAKYREGIARLAAGRHDAREALLEGASIAPMNPDLYLDLARACHEADLDPRAAEYYLKYLALRPDEPDADIARRELRALDSELSGVFDAPPHVPRARTDGVQVGGSQVATAAVSAVAGAAFTVAVGLLLFVRRRRGVSLERLARASPELHPAIAYLVGSLRHELLKHRIGAVGDAVSAIRRGDATKEQLAFLDNRLYGGQPVEAAWHGHLEAFERALGYRLDLERDRTFRRASRAIHRIASMKDRLSRGDASIERALSQAWGELREFDRELAGLVTHLVRTRVDGALLEQIVGEVRSEYIPSQVELDALTVAAPEEEVLVEVFRVDLVLILKNIVRNAILAVDKSAPPRRVKLDVSVDLEPTGEEVVFVRVHDTNDDRLSTESIYDRRVDRGLGLVTAALTRYDGASEVQPSADGYAKAVCVRFFRAMEGDGEGEVDREDGASRGRRESQDGKISKDSKDSEAA